MCICEWIFAYFLKANINLINQNSYFYLKSCIIYLLTSGKVAESSLEKKNGCM